MRGTVIALALFLLALVVACNTLLRVDPVSLWDGDGEADGQGGGVDASDSGARDSSLVADGGAGDSSVTDSSNVAEGESSTGCEGGQILCNGGCIPWNDPANCGSCGNSCADGMCGLSIAASMQTRPSGWLFNGAAALSDAGVGSDAGDASVAGSAILVPKGSVGVEGTVVYSHPIVAEAFTASFQFRMGFGGGSERANGMGFMLETNGPTAVGSGGGGLGISGLTGYGVELDIYNNMNCGDTNNDHIGIDLLPPCEPCVDTTPTSLYASQVTNFVDLGDAQWHSATVTLQAGAVSVAIDGNALANSALTGWTPGVAYFYGFGAAMGPNIPGYQAEVKDVSIVFPQPTCL
jgi:hypothetical protein